MIEIKAKKDVRNLKRNASLDGRYIEYVEKYFCDLMETFRENESDEDFSLAPYGYIVLLEATDDVTSCLKGIGIDDLLNTPIEFVNKVKLQKSDEEPLIIYQTFILYDNEYGMNLFSIAGTLSKEVEEYLAEYAVE